MSDFRPSPALLAAVTEALAILKRHHRAQMRLALDITTEGREFTADYCRTLAGIGPSFIVAAAETWLATGEKFAPKPGELAKMARELERQSSPDSDSTMARYTGPQSVQFTTDQVRANKVMRGIFDRVGSWIKAAEVWTLVLRSARHDDQRLAFEQGHVPPYIVDEAVEKVGTAKAPPMAPPSAAISPPVDPEVLAYTQRPLGPLAATLGLAKQEAPTPAKKRPEPFEPAPRQWFSDDRVPGRR